MEHFVTVFVPVVIALFMLLLRLTLTEDVGNASLELRSQEGSHFASLHPLQIVTEVD